MSRKHDNEKWPDEQQHRAEVTKALAHLMAITNHGHSDSETVEQAGVIYGLLRERHYFDEMPASAVAYAETFIGHLCDEYDIHAWNDYLLAPIVWCVISSIPDGGNAGFQAFLDGIKALCTEGQYKSFLTRHGLEGGEPEEDTKWERDEMAAFKIARYLADPRTDPKTKRELGAALFELSSETEVHVDHPALAERAASIMFESVNDDSDAPTKRIYEHIRAMLDELPDMPEGGK